MRMCIIILKYFFHYFIAYQKSVCLIVSSDFPELKYVLSQLKKKTVSEQFSVLLLLATVSPELAFLIFLFCLVQFFGNLVSELLQVRNDLSRNQISCKLKVITFGFTTFIFILILK
jgi:hypothetical protein